MLPWTLWVSLKIMEPKEGGSKSLLIYSHLGKSTEGQHVSEVGSVLYALHVGSSWTPKCTWVVGYSVSAARGRFGWCCRGKVLGSDLRCQENRFGFLETIEMIEVTELVMADELSPITWHLKKWNCPWVWSQRRKLGKLMMLLPDGSPAWFW